MHQTMYCDPFAIPCGSFFFEHLYGVLCDGFNHEFVKIVTLTDSAFHLAFGFEPQDWACIESGRVG